MNIVRPLRQIAKSSLEHALARLPLRPTHNARLILAYHNIIPDSSSIEGDTSLHLKHSVFCRQLDEIRKIAQITPLMDILTKAGSGTPRVAITFDDAYEQALRVGLRECVHQDIPATMFVSPQLFGTVPPWDYLSARGEWSSEARERYLSHSMGDPRSVSIDQKQATASHPTCRIGCLDDLREFQDSSQITLGNHLDNHLNAARISPEVLEEQLVQCKALLTKHFARSYLPVLAYPYGLAPSSSSSREVIGKHVDFALLVNGGWINEKTEAPFDIPRRNVASGASIEKFRAFLGGWSFM